MSNSLIGQSIDSVLKNGQELFNNLSKYSLMKLRLNDMSWKTIKESLCVSVSPTQLQTPQDCIQLGCEILSKYEQVAFITAVSQTKLTVLKRSSDLSFLEKFNQLVDSYKESGKKLPAKDTLVSLAQFETQEINTAVAIAELEVKFWKDILSSLDVSRKLLENISMNIAVERKILS